MSKSQKNKWEDYYMNLDVEKNLSYTPREFISVFNRVEEDGYIEFLAHISNRYMLQNKGNYKFNDYRDSNVAIESLDGEAIALWYETPDNHIKLMTAGEL